jgi:hypothetical protein
VFCVRALWMRGRWRVIAVATLGLLLAGGTFGALQLSAAHATACEPLAWSVGPTGNLGPNGFLPSTRVGPTGQLRPGPPPPAPIDVHFNRTGATLDSIDVNVEPRLAYRHAAVYVLHRGGGCLNYYSVVYASRIWDTSAPSARHVHTTLPATAPYFDVRGPSAPFSAWSGSLHPRDWVGGCQSGDYEVYVAMPVSFHHPRMTIDGYYGSLASYSTPDFTCKG